MAMLDKKLGANDRHRMEGDNSMPMPSMRNKKALDHILLSSKPINTYPIKKITTYLNRM